MTLQTGLTGEQARAALLTHGRNELPRPHPPRLGVRLLAELREPMAVLLVAAAAVSGVVLHETVDAIAILAIVVVNAVIALVQQGRAERALQALERIGAPTALVVRDGRRQEVDAALVVPGDLVVVATGDRVPADLSVVGAEALEVDEAVLTGESLPVPKRPGGATSSDVTLADRDGMLFSGTFVTRGSGTGRVVATGVDAALGAIAARLASIEREPTPLQRQLGGLTRRLGSAAVVVAGVTFGLTLLVRPDGGAQDAFLMAVALAVAAVPEGLAAVTTVALALGVHRMARAGAIVRRLPAVETLGAVDVLVADKTGTLTRNQMRVHSLIAPSGDAHDADGVPADLRAAVLPIVVLCNDATLDPPTGDATERALLELAPASYAQGLRDVAPRLALSPFTPDTLSMASVHVLDGRPMLLVKGAPEAVLARCTGWRGTTSVQPLTMAHRDRLLARVEEHAARGERLLALARRELVTVPDAVQAQLHDLELVGLVALRDPPRESARQSVDIARSAGVTILMATGDHPATAAAIAREVGVVASATTARVPGLAGFPDDPTTEVVYARVSPDQKLDLVNALRARGHTVAMTGDGVNDAPALRRADIGVALGATGSDVAREAADLVITDDDLATIVSAIREGRGIYDNLRKVVDYLVASNLAEVIVVVTALFVWPQAGVPLLPLQLLWINLLTDGLPALALGVDPLDDDLMRRRPRSARERLLDGPHLRALAGRALALAIGPMAALVIADRVLGLGEGEARTVLFSAVVVAQVLYAFGVAHRPFSGERNRWLYVAAVVALSLQVLVVVVHVAQRLFDTVVPSAAGWSLITAGGVASAVAARVVARNRGSLPRAGSRPVTP